MKDTTMIPVTPQIIKQLEIYNEAGDSHLLNINDLTDKIPEHILSEANKVFYSKEADKVNVDISDLETVVKETGKALLGFSQTNGSNRALEGIQKALNRTEEQIQATNNSRIAILSINAGTKADFELDELTAVTEYLQQQLGEQTELIFGHSKVEELEDSITVLVIVSSN